jgi:MazG family protein
MTKPTDTHRPPPADSPGDRFDRLVDIMRTLRSPDGCSWDREQTLASLRPFVLEEAYEVVDAIDRGDTAALCGELGDLLLEAVFVAQICAEDGAFTIADAADAVVAKLIRRHPHVFGDSNDEAEGGGTHLSPAEVKEQWERIKARERSATPERETLLDGIPEALPSLLRASRIGARTANVGFDWDEPAAVIDKVGEEMAELREAMEAADSAHIEEEVGDLLFTVANLARKLRIDPESALRSANGKFTRRFRAIEHRFAARGRSLHEATAAELEHEWQTVKALPPEETGSGLVSPKPRRRRKAGDD